MAARLALPDLGIGVGLRVPHYRHILEHRPPVDFFEIISENFMVAGGKPLYHLERVLESYQLVQHGVSLSIGGPEPPDRDYLVRLKNLVRRVNPPWVSDHLCWCGAGGAHLHDLLPLPFTEEAIQIVVERAKIVQDLLEVPFALENTSSYLTYTASTMPEWEFVSRVAEEANIGLLFDVNNVYVSAYNHGFDPMDFISAVPRDRIVQIHLAGHTNLGKYIIDTHRGHVIDPVLDLYRRTIELTGPVSTLVEWDDDIPTWDVLSAEAQKVRLIRRAASGAAKGEPLTELAGEQAQEEAALPIASERRAWIQGGPREIAADEIGGSSN